MRTTAGGPLHIELSSAPSWSLLADEDVLSVVQFGAGPSWSADPRHVVTGFTLLGAGPPGSGSAGIESIAEVWRVDGAVQVGTRDMLRYAVSRDYLFGQIEIAADSTPAFAAASKAAYVQLLRCCQDLGYPHVLRIWNVLSGINEGAGDAERYRVFCQGRYDGFVEAARLPVYPAASALGPAAGPSLLYFLAGRAPAHLIENPQQLSAFRYPRDYGPASPSFSRAGLVRCGDELRLFISGTASILGHRSCHEGDLIGQLDVTLQNLARVAAASQVPGALFAHDNLQTQLRIYLRNSADLETVSQALAARVSPSVGCLFVQADICRRELLLEIEATVSWREG